MPQAKHRCRLCGQTGHRQETCRSYAGEVIRGLKAQLGKAGRAAKERRVRRVRKNGLKKVEARQRYSGTSQAVKRNSWVQRTHVEAVRELVSDPERCLQQLIADGICKEPSRCSHCGSQQVQRSQCHRGARDGHLFISCAKCHKYTNCLFYSPFRHTRSTAAEIVEFLDCYLRQNLLSRPVSTQLNRELGFGRKRLDHLIQVCLKAESMIGKDRNRKLVLRADSEVDAHALKRFFVSAANPAFKHLQKCGGALPGPKVFQCHIRLAGLCIRAGALAVSLLPAKLVKQRAPPPPESLKENV